MFWKNGRKWNEINNSNHKQIIRTEGGESLTYLLCPFLLIDILCIGYALLIEYFLRLLFFRKLIQMIYYYRHHVLMKVYFFE